MSHRDESQIIPIEHIGRSIVILRGQKVILDADLAELYEVETKALVQAVKRNLDRFPEEFMFQLTKQELMSNRSQFVTGSQKHRAANFRPYAFTEHGVAMLSAVLKSKRAAQMSVLIIKAFVRLRELLANHKELASKLEELERKLETHDQAIVGIFKALHELMNPARTNAIGFTADLGNNPKRGVV
jgi:hypothetical protein